MLNRAAVEIMLKSDWLFCPSQSYPDDVALGKWLNLAKISITSSPLFHQVRTFTQCHEINTWSDKYENILNIKSYLKIYLSENLFLVGLIFPL